MSALDEDDDLLAAEYVLGTLDAAERVAARARIAADADFDEAVQAWEYRLSPLAAIGRSEEPASDLLAGILDRIDAVVPAGANLVSLSDVLALRRKLRVWRTLASAAGAIAAMLALWMGYTQWGTGGAHPQSYLAVLQQGAGAPSFVVSLNLADRRMTVVPLGADVPSGKSYELWMISSDKSAPRSLGLLSPNGANHPVLPDANAQMISTATYAVTIEPQGGSPSGQPTTAPLYVGHLLDTAR